MAQTIAEYTRSIRDRRRKSMLERRQQVIPYLQETQRIRRKEEAFQSEFGTALKQFSAKYGDVPTDIEEARKMGTKPYFSLLTTEQEKDVLKKKYPEYYTKEMENLSLADLEITLKRAKEAAEEQEKIEKERTGGTLPIEYENLAKDFGLDIDGLTTDELITAVDKEQKRLDTEAKASKANQEKLDEITARLGNYKMDGKRLTYSSPTGRTVSFNIDDAQFNDDYKEIYEEYESLILNSNTLKRALGLPVETAAERKAKQVQSEEKRKAESQLAEQQEKFDKYYSVNKNILTIKGKFLRGKIVINLNNPPRKGDKGFEQYKEYQELADLIDQLKVKAGVVEAVSDDAAKVIKNFGL